MRRSSRGFAILRTKRPPSADWSRKFWSRSLGSAVARAVRPKRSAARRSASSAFSRGASTGEVIDGQENVARKSSSAPNSREQPRLTTRAALRTARCRFVPSFTEDARVVAAAAALAAIVVTPYAQTTGRGAIQTAGGGRGPAPHLTRRTRRTRTPTGRRSRRCFRCLPPNKPSASGCLPDIGWSPCSPTRSSKTRPRWRSTATAACSSSRCVATSRRQKGSI